VIRNSFVSGGTGSVHSSGVDVNTGGGVTVGLCTVSAGLTSINGQDAAAIRIRAGRPALGGNIFFTRGTGKRPAVLEEAADADPSRFEANLIFSVSQPAYDNYATDGLDASDTAALNNFQIINNISGTVRENLLVTAAAADVFESVSQLDYHLVNPSRAGGPNPAVDSLPQVFNGPLYGIQTDGPPDDIDGELRPNSYLQYDRGADEF